MRRQSLIIAIVSTLLAVAVGGLWLRSRTAYETVYVRTGAWFWQLDSAQGSISLQWYGGWPSPPAYRHEIANHDPLQGVGPVFAIRYAGAIRSKWHFGLADGEYGTTRVAVGPSGAVRWDTPALPILHSLTTTRFSPLFRFWSISVPHWAVVTLLLLPLAAIGVQRTAAWLVRRSRQSRGLCPACAYDLRCSPDRCPECGRTVTAAGGAMAEV